MTSQEYRNIISRIATRIIKERFPGLNSTYIKEVAAKVAIVIHARMYGANVDGVDSPIWQDRCKPKPVQQIDAAEILKDLIDEKGTVPIAD